MQRELKCLTAMVVALFAASAVAAPPSIKKINVRGLQTGGATTLVIEGENLLPEPRLLASFPIAEQKLKEGATAEKIELEVALASDVAPGIYRVYLATQGGAAPAVAMGVDPLPQREFGSKIESLPVALHGECVGDTIHRTSFTGKKGEKVVIEVEAGKIGGALRPVVHLYDSRDVPIAWAQDSLGNKGYARLTKELPADGVYSVEVHDALFKGPKPGIFRLKIGDFHYADVVFPLAVQQGTKATVEFVDTNLPADTRVEADLTAARADMPAPLPADKIVSGAAPCLHVSEITEHIESKPADGSLQTIEAPGAINGRLSEPREEDQYRVVVKPGAKLRFEMLAAGVGSPVDGVLTLRDENGKQLATNDDRSGRIDPGVDFTVPKDTTAVVLSVRDLQRRGGPEFVYRVSVEPMNAPDFSLAVLDELVHMPKSGVAIARVRAERKGYRGPIELTVENLPPGVTATHTKIPANATDALITFQGEGELAQVLGTIVGESVVGDRKIRRVALLPETPLTAAQPWLRHNVAFALTPPVPLSVNWKLPDDAQLSISMTDKFQVAVNREDGAKGEVRLSLVTSQNPPQKRLPPRNFFAIPPEPPRFEPDTEKMLRLESPVTVPADQSEATVTIIVPPELPKHPYDLAVKAELLADDGKTVVATAVTPPVRLDAVQPFKIEIADAKVEAKSGEGETGTISGRVIRRDGFKGPVTITLAGLPADVRAPMVDVAADQSEFKLPVSLPFGTPPGELKGAKVIAQYRYNPAITLSSNEAPIEVTVVPGDPPPPLYAVFEDEPHFPALLNEGEGRVELFVGDRYSGATAVRVTRDRRFRTKAPGLGVKITENPGPGEYRYLRFAWKSEKGGAIGLSLAANGAFANTNAGDKEKPSYRYHAGAKFPINNLASVQVDEKLPSEWTVVTRDLFADFGEFQLDGVGLNPGKNGQALLDHVYLARSMSDFEGCPGEAVGDQPLAIFEDEADFIEKFDAGGGVATIVNDVKYSGEAAIRLTPDHRSNPKIAGMKFDIREKPGEGQYRYITFAWKKKGGSAIALQLANNGNFGLGVAFAPNYRYDAANVPDPTFGASTRVSNELPEEYTVVTRDLFADFGEFTITGIGLVALDGEEAFFDRIYLGRSVPDFRRIEAPIVEQPASSDKVADASAASGEEAAAEATE